VGRGIKSFDEKLTSAGLPGLITSIEQRLAERGRCRVLEAGCGEGRLLLELLAHFGERVALHGLNLADWPPGEQVLRGSNEHYKVLDPARLAALPLPTIHVADLQDLSALPERDFDLVLSQAVMPHVIDKARALEESARVLAPDGMFMHELDCLDLPPLDFVDDDLPRFTIYQNASRISATEHLRDRCVQVLTCRRTGVRSPGLLALHRRSEPLSLGLTLDRTSTLKLGTIASCDAPLGMWGTRSVYRASP
jgi:SAM-dependent methyltransferase